MPRRYYACAFKASSRPYTYHFDGEPFAVGDRVIVETTRGPQTVTVVSIVTQAPRFDTKPIVGKERPVRAPESSLVDLGEDWGRDMNPEEMF